MNDKIQKVIDEVKALTPEQIREELIKVRVRQRIQQEVQPSTGPFLCERCGSNINVGDQLVDVTVSYQSRPQDEEDIEWDPQDETYLCNKCGTEMFQFLSAKEK
jgi:hypothetical protein